MTVSFHWSKMTSTDDLQCGHYFCVLFDFIYVFESSVVYFYFSTRLFVRFLFFFLVSLIHLQHTKYVYLPTKRCTFVYIIKLISFSFFFKFM